MSAVNSANWCELLIRFESQAPVCVNLKTLRLTYVNNWPMLINELS